MMNVMPGWCRCPRGARDRGYMDTVVMSLLFLLLFLSLLLSLGLLLGFLLGLLGRSRLLLFLLLSSGGLLLLRFWGSTSELRVALLRLLELILEL